MLFPKCGLGRGLPSPLLHSRNRRGSVAQAGSSLSFHVAGQSTERAEIWREQGPQTQASSLCRVWGPCLATGENGGALHQKWEVRERGAALTKISSATCPGLPTSPPTTAPSPAISPAPHCSISIRSVLPPVPSPCSPACLLLQLSGPPLAYLLPSTGTGRTTGTGSWLHFPSTPHRSLLRTGVPFVHYRGCNVY